MYIREPRAEPRGGGEPSGGGVRGGNDITVQCALARQGEWQVLLFVGPEQYGQYEYGAAFDVVYR